MRNFKNFIGGYGKLLLMAVFFMLSSNAFAEKPANEFAGVKKCSLCHKKPEQGEQFAIWEKSAHAKAFQSLGTEEAKQAAAKLGIADPQKDPKCLKCHSTAYWFSESKVTEVIPVEEGVSCESCHGAGKAYMKKTIMEKRDEAIKNGLIIPDEALCVKCHNSESPTFKSFDFQTYLDKIKHPVPKK